VFCFVLFAVSVSSQTDIPDEPEFVSASVVPESNPTTVKLKWNASDSLDVAGYIIYEVVDFITVTIDTVWGRENVECTFVQSGTLDRPEIFRIAAFDNLFFKSKITDPHTTMFLDYEYDKCNNKTELSWTAYVGWPNGVSKYNVYRRSGESPYQLLSTITSGSVTYVDDEVAMNTTYYYYIEAVSSFGYKATSNSVEIETESYVLPSYIYAESASVSGDDVIVKFIMDNSAEVLEYRVQRSLSSDAGFSTIRSVANAGQSEILFTDTEVNVDETVYYYRLASVNPCGVINSYSNNATNIVFSAETLENLNHSMSWTNYEAWENGVFNYRVNRYFDETSAEISVNSSGDLDFVYDIAWYVDYCHDREVHVPNKYCYYVEAYENPGHSFSTTQGVSRSNISCVYHDPVLWMPTAFNITSYEEVNREFKPVISFAEKEPYEFIVYDKWGLEIFRSEDTFRGWNGSLNYSTAPSQYYTYIIRYYDHTNKEHIQSGTFFLLVE